jgi:hypothetical protein
MINNSDYSIPVRIGLLVRFDPHHSEHRDAPGQTQFLTNEGATCMRDRVSLCWLR